MTTEGTALATAWNQLQERKSHLDSDVVRAQEDTKSKEWRLNQLQEESQKSQKECAEKANKADRLRTTIIPDLQLKLEKTTEELLLRVDTVSDTNVRPKEISRNFLRI